MDREEEGEEKDKMEEREDVETSSISLSHR